MECAGKTPLSRKGLALLPYRLRQTPSHSLVAPQGCLVTGTQAFWGCKELQPAPHWRWALALVLPVIDVARAVSNPLRTGQPGTCGPLPTVTHAVARPDRVLGCVPRLRKHSGAILFLVPACKVIGRSRSISALLEAPLLGQHRTQSCQLQGFQTKYEPAP